jgi:superfamily I DNA/RNA helicase
LRLANLDTATGLEAPIVFLLGAESLLSAASAGQDEEDTSARREEQARKLYMAMTRAAERLVVITSTPVAYAGCFSA